jgi:hypothetical protein
MCSKIGKGIAPKKDYAWGKIYRQQKTPRQPDILVFAFIKTPKVSVAIQNAVHLTQETFWVCISN